MKNERKSNIQFDEAKVLRVHGAMRWWRIWYTASAPTDWHCWDRWAFVLSSASLRWVGWERNEGGQPGANWWAPISYLLIYLHWQWRWWSRTRQTIVICAALGVTSDSGNKGSDSGRKNSDVEFGVAQRRPAYMARWGGWGNHTVSKYILVEGNHAKCHDHCDQRLCKISRGWANF